MSDIKPTGKRIFVELMDLREQDELYLPHTWKVYQAGKVKKIGPDVTEVDIGDIVYFRRFNPNEVDGYENHVLTHEDNIEFRSNEVFRVTVKKSSRSK